VIIERITSERFQFILNLMQNSLKNFQNYYLTTKIIETLQKSQLQHDTLKHFTKPIKSNSKTKLNLKKYTAILQVD